MTIASLLLALWSPQSHPSDATSEPVLLDFHAEWCGPCHKVRPAVEQLIAEGISDQVDRYRPGSRPGRAIRRRARCPPSSWSIAQGRELDRTSGRQPAAQLARFYHDAKAKAQPPANSRAHADGDAGDDADGAADEADSDRDAATKTRSRADQNAGPERDDEKPAEPAFRIPSRGKPSSASGSSPSVRPASARARSFTARPKSR